MVAQTGRPLNATANPPAKKLAGVTVLLDKNTFGSKSPIFEVIDVPTVLRLYNAVDGQQVRVLSVYGPQDDLQEQPYRPYGQDIYLNANYNCIVLRISGRYRLEVVGFVTDILVTSEAQLLEPGREVMQASGTQANRPNLLMGDNGQMLVRSKTIEIINDAWIFNAYGLEPGNSVTVYQIYDKGTLHKEEVFRFNGTATILTDTKNSVKLNKTGRYVFIADNELPTDTILVGNPTTSSAIDELDIEGGGIVILGSYATFGDLVAAHPTANVGDAYMVGEDLYVWTGVQWQNVGPIRGPQGPQGEQGDPGQAGSEVELQNNGTHIQWRYVGAPSWTNLVALSTLIGPPGADGREIQLQNTGTQIQWRYVGDVGWTNLISVAAITGPRGPQGDQGDPGTDGTDGVMASIVAGLGIAVDSTDPANPIVATEDVVTAVASVAGVATLDLALSNGFTLTLTEDTDIVIGNVPAAGTLRTFALRTLQDGTGGWVVTFPAEFMFADGSDTTIDTGVGTYALLIATTFDGGVRWEVSLKAVP
jgi:hypothetical protein